MEDVKGNSVEADSQQASEKADSDEDDDSDN